MVNLRVGRGEGCMYIQKNIFMGHYLLFDTSKVSQSICKSAFLVLDPVKDKGNVVY